MRSPLFFANGSILYNVGDAERISVLSDDPSMSAGPALGIGELGDRLGATNALGAPSGGALN